MDEIIEVLVSRLRGKGLSPVEINRFTKDVQNIIEYGGGGVFTLATIKDALVRLGWDESVMDSFILQLIISYFEIEGTYKVSTV